MDKKGELSSLRQRVNKVNEQFHSSSFVVATCFELFVAHEVGKDEGTELRSTPISIFPRQGGRGGPGFGLPVSIWNGAL
jgi:hypothetical protein